ncbi:MFS transporter [Microbispora triticiradicis]|uniref:MFS transporter n=1 Tax=Microbispora triticiradicis TaxID=2200763 RepID=A0ABX9LLA5_9ACTN|nr:MFS transporter [Microbispora triticiradicis]RGA04654.1 MFS transporter [Microbispora triticiradicis]
MRAALPLRLARSAAFTVVCVLLAVGAHWFAGGATPTLRALLVGGAAVMTTATAMAGRERSPWVVIGLLLSAQAFLHELLASLSPSVETTAVAHSHRLGVGAGMLTAHVTAAVVTGWWLSRGEAALWSILRKIGTGALRWLRAVLAVFQLFARLRPRPRLASYDLDREPRRGAVLRHAVIRRGPPVLVFL